MPGVHKSPLYKGIGKYKKKAKGQRGFKMGKWSPFTKTEDQDLSGSVDETLLEGSKEISKQKYVPKPDKLSATEAIANAINK